MNQSEPTMIVLHLRPAPGNWRTGPTQRLRLALKVLLRGFGLRAVSVTATPPAPKPEPHHAALPGWWKAEARRARKVPPIVPSKLP